MALADGNNNGMVMPVAPYNNGGYGNNMGFGNDWFAWLVLLFLIGGNNGWGGGMFGNNGGELYPWLNQSQDISNVLQSLSTQLCNGFASLQQSISNAQMGITNQLFASQTANMQGFNQLGTQIGNGFNNTQLGIADLKYTVANEGCNTRNSAMQNTYNILDNQNRGYQAIMDKLCQLELDGVKAQLSAKDDEISSLRQQVAMKDFAASQNAQNALMQQGFASEVDALYNRLANCPVPTTPVYGRTPIFTCNGNNGCGCGCGGNTGLI